MASSRAITIRTHDVGASANSLTAAPWPDDHSTCRLAFWRRRSPTRVGPTPVGAVDVTLVRWENADMILTVHQDRAEAELHAGRLSCECAGRLRPWGHARSRLIRQRDGSHVALRPRRAICTLCERTHVVLPLASLPRRTDAVETVGDALFKAASGYGYRTIARELALPPSTVRNWLRRACGRAEWLRQRAVRAGHDIDICLPFSPPRASILADALDALALAASAAIRRFGWVGTSLWRVIAALSGGHLLSPRPDG